MKEQLPDLVMQAKSGDTHAFALLYEEVYKDLYRFAYCTLKDAHRAEDAVSEAVLRAYEHIHKLKKTASFRSWIFQITANECKRQFRLQTRTIPVEDDKLFEAAADEPGLAERIALEQAFHSLNEQERLIVGLNVYAGYTSREIARYLHKKEGSVRSTKSRALDKMKHFLGGEMI